MKRSGAACPITIVDKSDAVAAIEYAKAEHPDLCCFGISSDPCDDDFDVEGVLTAMAYLMRWPMDHQPRWSSYFLKHRAENWGRAQALKSYITNGEFIVAAVFLGLPIKYGNGPNVSIGVRLPKSYVRRAQYGEVD